MSTPVQPSRTTLEWLYRILSPRYADPNRTYSDIAQVLGEYPSLRPRTEVYTDERGVSDLLLCLSGTIPTRFANMTYRIPIELWVPQNYPVGSPFVFVRPTESMLIHPGNYVDTNGRVYHPYMSYWKPEQTAVEMIRVIGEVFSREPPVYAKPPSYVPTTTTASRSSASPGTSEPNSPISATTPSPARASPFQPNPPLPPKPPKLDPLPQYSSANPPNPPINPPNPSINPIALNPSINPMPWTAPQMNPMGSRTAPASHVSSNAQNSPIPRQATLSTSVPLHNAPDIMDMDLPTMPSTSGLPPQRPPNPEKLMTLEKLRDTLNAIIENELKPEMEMDDRAVGHTAHALSVIESQMNAEKRELEAISAASAENERILVDRIEQARRVITNAKSRDEPDIDEVITAENVVYNQLYELVSEDAAIEDTIYVLGKALSKEKIGLEPFLKHTRTLAREQFFKRALVNKISTDIGL
ncbi:hypothetical protein TRVA0_018S01574 [Trichomonascus vanleenenianus]|uniref:ubiquitin-binding ESCRT-I subunit protein STP22 n=1 Tax=Trichomonascus vanleenenianus TaxID=2268995 RepID=UPI003ECAC611